MKTASASPAERADFARWEWYSLAQVKETFTCEHCLDEFPFNAATPPTNAWCFRVEGPFSLENYAQGGYTVALALRFLIDVMHYEASWITGMEIEPEPNGVHLPSLEADFALWSRKAYADDESLLLFGEGKSLNKEFEDKDSARALALLEQFLGSIFVFASLRQELGDKEKERLAKLTIHLRGMWGTTKRPSSLLVLTPAGLFSDAVPPYCWKELGGKYQPFADGPHYSDGMFRLCDCTQQSEPRYRRAPDARKRHSFEEESALSCRDDRLEAVDAGGPEPHGTAIRAGETEREMDGRHQRSA